MVYQEFELDLLPPHLRNPYLIPGIHYQDMFQILYSKIWNSGFLDSISRNQRIRVLNYVEFVAMREQRMCYTCEGKWSEDHDCENSCFVFFNPFDRDDDTVEEEEEVVEKTIEKNDIDTSWAEAKCFDGYCCVDDMKSLDQMLVGKLEETVGTEVSIYVGPKTFDEKSETEQEIEGKVPPGFNVEFPIKKQFKELSTLPDWKVFDRMLERELDQNVDEACEAEYIEEIESSLSQPSVRGESGKIQEVSVFKGVKVCYDKPEGDLGKDFISSRQNFETDSIVEFKQGEVKFLALPGADEIVENWFCFYNWYKGRVLSVYICERIYEYKSIVTKLILKNIIRCGLKKDPGKMKIFQFDPGENVSRGPEITHRNPDCYALVFKYDGPDVEHDFLNAPELVEFSLFESYFYDLAEDNFVQTGLILNQLTKLNIGLVCGWKYRVDVSRTSPVNILSPVGYCFESQKRALIYEYIPNGSIEKYICNKDSGKYKLGWDVLYNNTKKGRYEFSRLTFDPGGKRPKNRKIINHNSKLDSEAFDLLNPSSPGTTVGEISCSCFVKDPDESERGVAKHILSIMDYNKDGTLSFAECSELIDAFGNKLVVDKEFFRPDDKDGDVVVCVEELSRLLAIQQEKEFLINCCPVYGEVLDVLDSFPFDQIYFCGTSYFVKQDWTTKGCKGTRFRPNSEVAILQFVGFLKHGKH